MIYCLCGSIIFMVIIMIVFLSELGKYIDEDGNLRLTNQHLRGISTISNLLYVEGIIDYRYNKIRNGVIENAVKGKTNVDFTIMCISNLVFMPSLFFLLCFYFKLNLMGIWIS